MRTREADFPACFIPVGTLRLRAREGICPAEKDGNWESYLVLLALSVEHRTIFLFVFC